MQVKVQFSECSRRITWPITINVATGDSLELTISRAWRERNMGASVIPPLHEDVELRLPQSSVPRLLAVAAMQSEGGARSEDQLDPDELSRRIDYAKGHIEGCAVCGVHHTKKFDDEGWLARLVLDIRTAVEQHELVPIRR